MSASSASIVPPPLANATDNLVEREQITCTCTLHKFVKLAAVQGVVGAVASFLFAITNPVSAFIFASNRYAMQELLKPGVEKVLSEDNNLPSQIYILAVTFIFSTCVSISMTIALGFPMSVPSALILSLFMIPTSHLVDFAYHKWIASSEAT